MAPWCRSLMLVALASFICMGLSYGGEKAEKIAKLKNKNSSKQERKAALKELLKALKKEKPNKPGKPNKAASLSTLSETPATTDPEAAEVGGVLMEICEDSSEDADLQNDCLAGMDVAYDASDDKDAIVAVLYKTSVKGDGDTKTSAEESLTNIKGEDPEVQTKIDNFLSKRIAE